MTKHNIKTIKADQLEPFCVMPRARIVMWRGMAVTVREFIPLAEALDLVYDTINMCHDEKNDKWVPAVCEFAFRINVIARYANVELPESSEKQYTLVFCTDLYNTIIDVVNKTQIESMRNAVGLYF